MLGLLVGVGPAYGTLSFSDVSVLVSHADLEGRWPGLPLHPGHPHHVLPDVLQLEAGEIGDAIGHEVVLRVMGLVHQVMLDSPRVYHATGAGGLGNDGCPVLVHLRNGMSDAPGLRHISPHATNASSHRLGALDNVPAG